MSRLVSPSVASPVTCSPSSFATFFFFFNDTATTEIYTLSLHDALPICGGVHALDEPLGLVELVGDLADQLLQKVLERDEPRGPAVLVHHDRHVELLRLELLQKRVGTLGLGDEVRREGAPAEARTGRRGAHCE